MDEALELVAASNNPHKIRELRRLFPGTAIRTPAELGVEFHYREGGRSYLDNALGKALHLYGLVHRPVLADDSGLEVAALGGEPGVFSSRYGSEAGAPLPDGQRNRLLLERCASLADRRCRFICCMVAVLADGRFLAAQETFPGLLAREPAGTGGFGYDPIVYIPERGKSVAQLSDAEKDLISHRGKAARRLRGLLADGDGRGE